MNRDELWDKFCDTSGLEKKDCKKWFQSQKTIYGKLANMKFGQESLHLTDRQQWVINNFLFLQTHRVRHLTAMSVKVPA